MTQQTSPRQIVRDLGGEWLGSYGVAVCPVCQDGKSREKRALSVMDKGGYPYITCFKGCSPADVKRALGVGLSHKPKQRDPEAERDREAERLSRYEGAARKAENMLRKAVWKTHPYFAKKGFPDLDVPVLRLGDKNCAILPIKDLDGKLWNCQIVTEEGKKSFLKGGRLVGCGIKIGHQGRSMCVCEGFATGLSIYKAFRDKGVDVTVWCALTTAGIKGLPDAGIKGLVCADRDEVRFPKRAPKYGAGEWAALKSACDYVMPPIEGDFNDLHLSRGLSAVYAAIRPALKL